MQEPGSETGALPGALSLSHARSLRRRYRLSLAQLELRAPGHSQPHSPAVPLPRFSQRRSELFTQKLQQEANYQVYVLCCFKQHDEIFHGSPGRRSIPVPRGSMLSTPPAL